MCAVSVMHSEDGQAIVGVGHDQRGPQMVWVPVNDKGTNPIGAPYTAPILRLAP